MSRRLFFAIFSNPNPRVLSPKHLDVETWLSYAAIRTEVPILETPVTHNSGLEVLRRGRGFNGVPAAAEHHQDLGCTERQTSAFILQTRPRAQLFPEPQTSTTILQLLLLLLLLLLYYYCYYQYYYYYY